MPDGHIINAALERVGYQQSLGSNKPAIPYVRQASYHRSHAFLDSVDKKPHFAAIAGHRTHMIPLPHHRLGGASHDQVGISRRSVLEFTRRFHTDLVRLRHTGTARSSARDNALSPDQIRLYPKGNRVGRAPSIRIQHLHIVIHPITVQRLPGSNDWRNFRGKPHPPLERAVHSISRQILRVPVQWKIPAVSSLARRRRSDTRRGCEIVFPRRSSIRHAGPPVEGIL